MLNAMKCCGVFVLSASLVVGCSKSDQPNDTGAASTVPVTPDTAYLLTERPADAQGVGTVRQSDAEEVTVVGRIGGERKPFVEEMAAFTIVDLKVPHCAPEEGCPTPWDYCCTQNQVQDNKAIVKIVDADGKPVMKNAKNLLGVKELSTVVVQGNAQRDDQGNLVVLAHQVYVEKE